jgi:hypothetical protein
MTLTDKMIQPIDFRFIVKSFRPYVMSAIPSLRQKRPASLDDELTGIVAWKEQVRFSKGIIEGVIA